MKPQELCDLLDQLQIPTREAAKAMGISRVTLEQYLNGRRYPSHGGGIIKTLPKHIEILARSLKPSK